VKILFVAGFGPITADVTSSRRLYQDALGLAFEEEEGQYLHTDKIPGVRAFAIWPLTQAAEEMSVLRSRSPLFFMTWQVMHRIDEASLHGTSRHSGRCALGYRSRAFCCHSGGRSSMLFPWG